MTNGKPRNSNRAKVIPVVIMIITIIVYIYSGNKSTSSISVFKDEKVRLTAIKSGIASFNFDDKPIAYTNNSANFFFATKDGIYYITSAGEIRWNDTYSLASPILKGEGDYVAIAEIKGNTIFVYSKNGELFKKQLDNPILSFSVNRRGYTSVITQMGHNYEIHAYNPQGESVATFKHELSDIFPITTDISNDGKFFVTSFLNITDVEIMSNIAIALTDKAEDQNLADADKTKNGTVSAINKPRQMVASINFMENNKLICITESEIFCLNVELNDIRNSENKSEWVIPLENKMDAIAFIGERGFVYAAGDKIPNMQSETPNTLNFYSVKGVNLGKYTLDKRITYLSAGDDCVIAGTGRNFYAFNNKGGLLWSYTATQDVKQILFLENSSTVLFLSNTSVDVMKRVRSSDSEEKDEATELPESIDEDTTGGINEDTAEGINEDSVESEEEH